MAAVLVILCHYLYISGIKWTGNDTDITYHDHFIQQKLLISPIAAIN